MIALDTGDKIRGDAAAATVVDYTIHGFVGTTVTQLADGQLASSIGDLYTAGAAVGVSSIVLVNTDTSARAVNLYLTPSGGTARRIIPKDLSLGIGFSLYTDGKTITVTNASGEIQYTTNYGIHATNHTNGTDDIQDATAAQKGLATAAQITKLDAIEASADVTDATNVDAAGAVMEADFDAQTILAATTDDTPAALTVNEQEVVGRLTGGNVDGIALGIADDNVVQIDHASVADNDYAKFTANGLEGRDASEAKTDLGFITDLVDDTTPQLGGNLDLNDFQFQLKFEPGSDVTASGLIISVTVDTNAEGIGAPLFIAADGHFDTADADASSTSPSVVLALETGTGAKKVLVHGILRVDAWNWTTGPGTLSLIYVSTTVGTLTQTKPSGTDDVVQPVGWALSDDCIYFCPSLIYFTHT